jgi:hypothetical protein
MANNCLDESHALLVRSGFLRQVLAPNLIYQHPTHHMTRLTRESFISSLWAYECKTSSKH